MRKIFTLLTMLCLYVGASWAQTVVTTVAPGKKYVLRCKATDHIGYIADDGTKVKGKENNPTLFAFETTDEDGAYYLKSLESNKYLNTTDNKKIVASETPSTKWVLKTYAHTANVVSLNPVGVNNFLNNVQSHNDGTTSDLWLNPNHGATGPGSSNACSLWTLLEWNLELPELTTNENSPVYYTIKNVRGSVYAAYFGAAQNIRLSANIGDESLFYFTDGADGTYVIHNKVTGKKLAAVNSWNDAGINWHIKIAGVNQHYGYAIATDAALGTAWNNQGGANKSVATYSGNDIGSTWAFEKYEGTVPGIQLSTDEKKVLYNIQNARRGRYANFVEHYKVFTQEGSPALGSYWYFVQDKTAQQSAPEGVVACRVFNALHATGVEDHETGHMGTDQWPAKVYYIKKHEKDYYGYVIYDPVRAEDKQGWNAYGETHVGPYEYDDIGSIWNLIPTTKTIDQLKTEVTTQSNNLKKLVSDYEESDFYTYPHEAIATAKTAFEDTDVTGDLPHIYAGYLDQKKALATLANETKTTDAPAVGDYIRLHNRNRGGYLMMDDDANVVGTSDKYDQSTIWKVEEGGKLYNLKTEKYMGAITESAQVKGGDEGLTFDFANQTECYAVFKETTKSSGRVFGHMNGSQILVGWEKGSEASHWVISQLTIEESVAELKEIYDVVDNAFGTEPGQYKEMEPSPSDELYVAWAFAKEVLGNDEAKDVYMMSKLASDLKAKWTAQLANPDSRQINLPVQGKFYRLKNVASGRYMNVKEASSVVVTDEGNDLPATIFYLGDNNTMLSYSVGQYLDCGNKNLAAVGTSHSGEFAAARSGAKPNTIMYKNNSYWTFGNRDNNVSIDRGSTKPGANAEGYDWVLEEIKTLPVKITSAGYATLYAPVALEIPKDVKVYTAVKDDDSAYLNLQLVETGSIPANTGVILEATAKTYYFTVTDDDVVPALGTTNKLVGAYPKSVKKQDRKVYTLQNGAYGVGFYLFKGQDANKNTTYINGFRSWLELPNDSQAQSFRFKFGETTDIESLVTLQNAKAIYDLSGRRVENMDKGIYIVNGKKIVVK